MSPFDPEWQEEKAPSGAVYDDAIWAAILLAIEPALGGILLRSWSGPARDGYIAGLKSLLPMAAPFKKMPLHIADDRMLGGLDLPATLAAGRPVFARGLLAESEGGVLQLAMAERLSAGTAARIAAVMDQGAPFAVVALDEGDGPDEAPPAALAERLAFTVTAAMLPREGAFPEFEKILAAKAALANVVVTDAVLGQLCSLGVMLGIGSLRAPIFALRAARAAAAFAGKTEIGADEIAMATRLVLAPRATQMPSMAPEETPEEPAPETPPEPQETKQEESPQALEDKILDAAQAVLPPELLAALAAGLGPRRNARGGGSSGVSASLTRGRPAGVRPGALKNGARLSVIETLRAAAPWQGLRRKAQSARKISIKAEDFRIKKFKEQATTVAIFAVDASGSSAVNRLAEAKGAIQLLLAQCYVRRDQVALIAFRGRAADCLLPPTNALARAKRALAGLPGGGPTPLSHGINAARAMADAEKRKGHKPLLVLLTDGGANIGRDGNPGRAAAGADAMAAGKSCGAQKLSALIIDTSPRPNAFVAKLAAQMGGRYAPLPYADPASLTRLIRAEGGFDARSIA
jgi:magnesium chelatase subunit D